VRNQAARPSQRVVPLPAGSPCEPGLPPSCPACGAARILPLAAALAEPSFTLDLLQRSVSGRRIHLGQSSAGEWWVCRESLYSH
jgi:hypothetical protein